MTKTLVILLLVAVAMCATDHAQMFADFKLKYSRTYASAEEEGKRSRIFSENMKIAEKLQQSNPLARFGVNNFADVSAEEFKVRHNAQKFFSAKKPAVPNIFSASEVLKAGASSIDWRSKGAVTYVKDQGQCGSCWSFSATGSIEGQWFLAGNSLVAVSEQELVSCDTTDDACNGGLMDNAWAWIVSSQGGNIATESSYPYVSGSGSVPACALPKTTGSTISGHTDLPQSESQMATWMLTNGPISIGVDATSWQSYNGGIMTNCVSSQVDHGVLAVGFDDNNNPPYWIIKNSWAASWGEEGYIRVEKGTDQCLITSSPGSATVSGGPGPVPPGPPGPTPPPGPPPPPPPPPSSDFTQYVCNDWLCSSGCTKNSFPQNQCLQMSGGGSVIAQCSSAGLTLNVYTSSDCSGSSQSEVEPVDQCLQDTSGTYIYNVCPSSEKADGPKGTFFRRPVHLMKK